MPDWREILDRDGPAVWRTAYRLLGNPADADECFQKAFVDALKVSQRVDVRHWRGLLQRLVTARAVDRLRRNRRRGDSAQLADFDTVCHSGPSPLQSAVDAELAERLRIALAQIPSIQAEVFCLHVLEGWSYEEVAQHMARSTTAVGVLLHRARNRLRQLLSASAPADPPRTTEGCDPAMGDRRRPRPYKDAT